MSAAPPLSHAGIEGRPLVFFPPLVSPEPHDAADTSLPPSLPPSLALPRHPHVFLPLSCVHVVSWCRPAPPVAHMRDVGRLVLERDAPPGTPPSAFAFGFHVPPFFSIPHLHMHAQRRPYKSCWAATKYLPWATLFYNTAERVEGRLRREGGEKGGAGGPSGASGARGGGGASPGSRLPV